MLAVLETGGKQYKVEKGTLLEVEKLTEEDGKTITFEEVLLTSDGKSTKVGTPYVSGAKVMAKVIEQKRGEKIIVFKKKPKKRYERTQGHRQNYTLLEITDIKA
ncbi:50S ribosomal protein L21 [Candidatus Peregrinibacteria bacterium]|jgi:large subunit ribosomal protein L21|nr:50S ribosomal protein L21 [Candidatus Peregrinibacteria bacterium]MBT4055687.1 50S ribosomal protein L21 [Candidatus Peregrinibacteria bacterium]